MVCIIFRFLNDQELVESETVVYEYVKKDNMFHMTLLGDIKGQSGPVKVVAKNIGGEDSATAQMTVSGRAPTFIEKPQKCTIMEGRQKTYL